MRKFSLTLPETLVILHSSLILASMFALSQKWFLTPLPYDCVYVPFLIVSGPIVYSIAHYLQHVSEAFMSPDHVMIAWNLVPGTVCLILGGIQWYLIGCGLVRIVSRRRKLKFL